MKLKYIKDFNRLFFFASLPRVLMPIILKSKLTFNWRFQIAFPLTEKKHGWRNSKHIHFFLRMWTLQFSSTPTLFNVLKQMNKYILTAVERGVWVYFNIYGKFK